MKEREEHILNTEQIAGFQEQLRSKERGQSTMRGYLRTIRGFAAWLGGGLVTQERAIAWKAQLLEAGYRPETVNGKLSALNQFFGYLGWGECRVKYLRVQRRLFRNRERELEKGEYLRLLETAESQGKRRLALLMETICATGIRVSEVRYITVEAVQMGRAEVSLKGKIRTILIPNKLCRKLQKYARQQKTVSGEIFLTRNGKGLTRRQIWAEMKALSGQAGVAATKVFPHNLRHLFARSFYRCSRDVAKLADVLGHSSIETTRIYLISSGVEHARQLERLGLIS